MDDEELEFQFTGYYYDGSPACPYPECEEPAPVAADAGSCIGTLYEYGEDFIACQNK